MQQSAAFKILRTRLKTVPFSENIKRTSSANPYSQILQVTEDGNRNQVTDSAINFPSLLLQFENMQQQHRNHLKDQLQSRKSASAATLSQVFSFFSHIWSCYIWSSRYCCYRRNSCALPPVPHIFWIFCSCGWNFWLCAPVPHGLVFRFPTCQASSSLYSVVSFLVWPLGLPGFAPLWILIRSGTHHRPLTTPNYSVSSGSINAQWLSRSFNFSKWFILQFTRVQSWTWIHTCNEIHRKLKDPDNHVCEFMDPDEDARIVLGAYGAFHSIISLYNTTTV